MLNPLSEHATGIRADSLRERSRYVTPIRPVDPSIRSRLDHGASLHQRVERLALAEEHAGSKHPRVVIGEQRLRGTGGNELEVARDRCLIVDPLAPGIVLAEEQGLVTRN